MKTDRKQHKHQLETNWLANFLGEQIESVKPIGVQVGIVAGVILVAFVGYQLWSSTSQQSQTEAWQAYLRATAGTADVEPDVLNTVSSQHKGTMAAAWAKLRLADDKLNSGVAKLLGDELASGPNPSAAAADFSDARDLYQEVADSETAQSSDLIQQRATLGLARAYESMGDGTSLEKARELYKKITTAFPDGLYAQEAERRLEDLQRDSTKRFYDKLTAYEPPQATGPGTPGVRPSDEFHFPAPGSGPGTILPKGTGGEDSSDKTSDEPKQTEDGDAAKTNKTSEPADEKKPAESDAKSDAPPKDSP